MNNRNTQEDGIVGAKGNGKTSAEVKLRIESSVATADSKIAKAVGAAHKGAA